MSKCTLNVLQGHRFNAGNYRCDQTLRTCDHVTKLKILIFLSVFIGDSWKFMLVKISHYTAIASICPLSVCLSVCPSAITPFVPLPLSITSNSPLGVADQWRCSQRLVAAGQQGCGPTPGARHCTPWMRGGQRAPLGPWSAGGLTAVNLAPWGATKKRQEKRIILWSFH